MDKFERVLSATEDNAAAIAALKKSIPKKTRCVVLGGQKGNGYMTFGKVTSPGGAVAVVAFSGGGNVQLVCNDEYWASGMSPIIAPLPDGEVDLILDGEHDYARMLVIGVL